MVNLYPALVGKRAVIVEDEGITQMHLRRILVHAGLQVTGSAMNAQDGIDLVLDQRPDLVLMDINMPGELDGLDAAEAIMEMTHPCVIMVTAYNGETYRSRAEKIPTCGYIVKPVTSDNLIPMLEDYFTSWNQEQN